MMSSALSKDSRPFLPKGVRMKNDTVRDRMILVAPERTLALDDIGVAILELADGKASVADIVRILAEKYDAPRQTIGDDVVSFLRELIKLGYIEAGNDMEPGNDDG